MQCKRNFTYTRHNDRSSENILHIVKGDKLNLGQWCDNGPLLLAYALDGTPRTIIKYRPATRQGIRFVMYLYRSI